MNKSQQVLLDLVRLEFDDNFKVNIPKDIDWNDVYNECEKQGVLAITWSSIGKLQQKGIITINDENIQLLVMKWFEMVHLAFEERYKKYKHAIKSLAQFYREHEIKMMILKGYGLSLNYPEADLRPCGDIDVWLFREQKKGDKIIEESGIEVDYGHHIHTVFSYQGETIENHFEFINYHNHPENKELEEYLQKTADKECEEVEIDGEKIYIPSAQWNAIFLLRHASSHFAGEEIKIRHLIDWGTFVEKYSEKINWDELYSFAKKLNMHRFLECINWLCIKYLGISSKHFPSFSCDECLAERILDNIFNDEFGSYGHNSDLLKQNIVKRIVWRYKRWKSNQWKYAIVYKGNTFSNFISVVWGHILKPDTIR